MSPSSRFTKLANTEDNDSNRSFGVSSPRERNFSSHRHIWLVTEVAQRGHHYTSANESIRTFANGLRSSSGRWVYPREIEFNKERGFRGQSFLFFFLFFFFEILNKFNGKSHPPVI